MSDQKISIDGAPDYIGAFETNLHDRGYTSGSIKQYRQCCRHFVAWLDQAGIGFEAVDDQAIERFSRHSCSCPRTPRRSKRTRRYMGLVEGFVRFLEDRGVIPRRIRQDGGGDDLASFRAWLRRHRGTGEAGINRHADTIAKLRPILGDDPRRYDAALINRVVMRNLDGGSRYSTQQMCGSLRMYLRFLAASGSCPPALVGAIPRVPNWRLATLPRYILNDDVERVIASCDLTTNRGIRDRAILLLLARLALRAGDVAGLDLSDIDWDNALIRVAGKTRRAVALPLPQDAGDALLAYIERARPAAASTRVFIRVIAPVEPFASSSPVTIIVRDALKRAGIENVNLRGAYLLRHSAATNMLRNGATLDAVGAVLRHRSPDTTAIYAKVDVAMLSQVAQPWIGRVAC